MGRSTFSEGDCLDLAQDLYLRFCDDLKLAEADNRARVRLVSRIQIALHAASAGETMTALRERLYGPETQ